MPLNNTTDKSTEKFKRKFWICIIKDFVLRLIINASVFVTKLLKKMLLHCTIKCILQQTPVILNSDGPKINKYLFAIVISYDYSNNCLIQSLINFGYLAETLRY